MPIAQRGPSIPPLISVHPLTEGVASLPFTARIERVPFLSVILPSLLGSLSGMAPMQVLLRPSSEHILIVRAPGARDLHGCHSSPPRARSASKKGTFPIDNPSKLARLLYRRWLRVPHTARVQRGPSDSLYHYLREWPRLPFTARIERPPLHRGGSASKKGTWPLFSTSFSGRALREQRRPSATSPLLAAPETISLPPSVP